MNKLTKLALGLSFGMISATAALAQSASELTIAIVNNGHMITCKRSPKPIPKKPVSS